MYYEVLIACPECGDGQLIDPDYPGEPCFTKCENCKTSFVYSVEIKEKVKYFTEVKKTKK